MDDTSFNIIGLQSLLGFLQNIQIEIAHNGKEAVEIMQKNASAEEKSKIQLVFMDINMPVMDGMEAMTIITKMKRDNIITWDCKLIAVTAFNDYIDKQNSFNAGAVAHIPKPISIHQLTQTLEKIYLGAK